MEIDSLKKGFIITSCIAAGDGGSLLFQCKTKKNVMFDLLFTQYFFLNEINLGMIPGRIYFNQKLVDYNSQEESIILKGLSSIVSQKPSDDADSIKESIETIIDFFQSGKADLVKSQVEKHMQE